MGNNVNSKFYMYLPCINEQIVETNWIPAPKSGTLNTQLLVFNNENKMFKISEFELLYIID